MTLLTLLFLPAAPPAAPPPNVVVVLIDDMGYSDLGRFGGTRAQTPAADRLADEGLRFTHFSVNSPICSPSRTALTTGQYPQRWAVTSYLNNRRANRERGIAQWLDPAAPVLARQLQRAGYATGHFGKWHMGGQRDVGDAPPITAYGFDESLTNFEGLGPRVLGLKDAYDGTEPKLHHLGSHKLPTGPVERMDRSRITGRFVAEAVDFIDRAAAAGRPFYVNVWPDDVHSPFFPPEVLRDETDGSKRQLYDAVLTAADRQLAALFDRVRGDDALRENTLILLCSDNGHEPGAGASGPFRGNKSLLYEGGVRSPLIAWGPGLIDGEPGRVNDRAVFSAVDLNRSLYAVTGAPLPDAALDGEDVSPALLGRSEVGRSAPIFFRRPPDRPGGTTRDDGTVEDAPDLAARHGDWKLYAEYDGSVAGLYDVRADPGETTDLAAEHPGVTERLREALFAWNATMPKDAGDPSWVQAAAAKPRSSEPKSPRRGESR